MDSTLEVHRPVDIFKYQERIRDRGGQMTIDQQLTAMVFVSRKFSSHLIRQALLVRMEQLSKAFNSRLERESL